jgi:hypothetical protein
MYWKNPGFLWVEVAPGLLVACWVLAEWLDGRRLRQFGDPSVLGVSRSRTWQFVAFLMLVLALVSIAAVIPLPASKGEEAVPQTPETVILLDVKSLEPAAEQLWRTLEDGLQGLVEQAPGSRFSAVAAGSPPEILVPPTLDTKGLQIIISRLRFALQQRSGADLSVTLADLVGSPGKTHTNLHFVVVTALPVEEVEQVSGSWVKNVPAVLFAQVSGSGAAARYGWRTSTGRWTWTENPEVARDLLRTVGGKRPERQPLSLVQWCALSGFLLLAMQFVCSLAARSKTQGGPFA